MTTLMLSAALQRRIEPKGRILAIEPDPVRAATLRNLLPTDLGDFTIVTSVGDALRAIATHAPDLVLTSTFLPPAEEAALTARLRQLPVPHLQVITIPHFIDSEDESVRDGTNVRNFLKRRSALMKPGCDSETVRKQIEAYLEQAHALRLNQSRPGVACECWDVDYDSKSTGPRARFEQGLRRLVPVRDVQIRQAPVIPSEGSESIYFTVPSGSCHQPILQAIFEPDHKPSAAEFRLLKAAANLAAVVLEFAPLGDDGLSRAV